MRIQRRVRRTIFISLNVCTMELLTTSRKVTIKVLQKNRYMRICTERLAERKFYILVHDKHPARRALGESALLAKALPRETALDPQRKAKSGYGPLCQWRPSYRARPRPRGASRHSRGSHFARHRQDQCAQLACRDHISYATTSRARSSRLL